MLRLMTMTRDEALADADAEISRLEADGRGLFYIAMLYGIGPRRHQSRYFSSYDIAHLELPEYLQGTPGTLTLGYLRERLADIAQGLPYVQEKAERADSITADNGSMCGMQSGTQDSGRHLGDAGQRSFRVRDRGVHEGGEGQAA